MDLGVSLCNIAHVSMWGIAKMETNKYRQRIRWKSNTQLIMVMIFIILVSNTLLSYSSSIRPDPVPLALFLKDTLLFISYGEYNASKEYISIALNLSLDDNIAYLHKKLYNELMELVNVLEEVDLKKLNDTTKKDYVKNIIYRLYRLRINLEQYLDEYTSKLYGLISDHLIKVYIMNETQKAVFYFLENIDKLIDEIRNIYLHRIAHIVHVNIDISIPQIILANDTFKIDLEINVPSDLRSINTSIIIIYGNKYYITFYKRVLVNYTTSIILKPPSVEDLISKGVVVGEEIPLEIRVKAYEVVHNTIYSGSGIFRSKIHYIKPLCTFHLPPPIYPGSPLHINIIANIDYPLNLTIYLNNIDEESIIGNTTIYPGNNTIEVTKSDLPDGVHRLFFKINGKGYYYSMIYEVPFNVNRISLQAGISLPKMIIGPPYVIPINLDIDRDIPFNITVYINNKRVFSRTINVLSNRLVRVTLPYPLLTWTHHVEVLVEPLNPIYRSYRFSALVYSIDIPLMLIALIIFGYAISTYTPSYGLSISIQSIVKYFRRSRYLVRGIEKSPVIKLETRLKKFFKPATLIELYHRFIHLMLKYVGPPRNSETLREYYHRISIVFSNNMRQLIIKFISLYERDLYSRHKVDRDEAENIVHELEESLG